MDTVEINGDEYSLKCFDYIKKIQKTIKSEVCDTWIEEVGKEKALEQLGSKDGKLIPDKYANWYFETGFNGERITLSFNNEQDAKEKYSEILSKVHAYVY